MINELIPIFDSTFNSENIKTINARDLHSFLEIGTDFSTWMKGRIDQYDFVENQDFITCSPNSGSVTFGGHNRIDYHISIDMAKELAMVERNEKGKEARLYFIKCEKELINIIKQMSLTEIVSYSIDKLLEHERQIAKIESNQNQLTSRVDSIEAESKRLRSHSDYYTIIAFCNIVKFKVSLKTSAQIGKECTKYCRSNNLKIDKTHDVRFGTVNVYPVDVLVLVCSQLFPTHNFDVIYI